MGNLMTFCSSYEYEFLEKEKKTWAEHRLQFDGNRRDLDLKILSDIKDGTDIHLEHVKSTWGGIPYQHWFVTDGTHFIQFGPANSDIYKAVVTITTGCNAPLGSKIVKTIEMSETVRCRVLHLLGMNNYSLCLRNSEHVANYIFSGNWNSRQMDSRLLMDVFKLHITENKFHVNRFPSTIRPKVFDDQGRGKLYSFISDHFTATRLDYYLDRDKDTYNILMVGPTGAGKSHLVNVLFNQRVCESEASHRSLTQDVYFIRGQGRIYDVQEDEYVERDIVVADTIGLCDTEGNDADVLNFITSRGSANFEDVDTVCIVVPAGRISPEVVKNIKYILEWLKYRKRDNYRKFQFVTTFSENLEASEEDSLRKELMQIFDLKPERYVREDRKFETVVYTGFPPEAALNSMTKERVKHSWESLKMLQVPGLTDRISVGQNDSHCNIL